jgi:hypothetical protein
VAVSDIPGLDEYLGRDDPASPLDIPGLEDYLGRDYGGGGGPGGGTAAQQDAFSSVLALLQRYGLESLADWAWQQIVDQSNPDQIIQSLRERDEYRQRFKAIFDREAAGLPAISADEVLAYERQAVALMRNYGFPETFWDTTDDLARLIVADISPAELEKRLQGYVEAAVQAPVEYRNALESLYGFGPGDIATIYADPTTALDVLERRWRASALGGEAARQGYGAITATEAERLDSLGLDKDAAAEGFGTLARSGELFTPLDAGEGGVDRATQLAALGGDTAAQEEIEKVRRRRLAQGSGGGSFAGSDRGLGGVGSST